MKYKISIEMITEAVEGNSYGTSHTVYEQTVERDETFLTGVILEVNKLNT
jgi:hypothetical protein